MPQLILVRHGNTFESGETPTFVGGRTDMNLTAKGEAQGQAIAAMIHDKFMPLESIVTGPLIRTRRFAEMIHAETGVPFSVDQRLCEIDYGLWENKTTEDVIAQYGAACFEAWEFEGVWPATMGWSPDQATLNENIRSLLAQQHEKLRATGSTNRVLVTSNGILRIVYRLVTGHRPDNAAKVKTGHYCVLSPTAEGWTIDAWNEKPA